MTRTFDLVFSEKAIFIHNPFLKMVVYISILRILIDNYGHDSNRNRYIIVIYAEEEIL